MLERIRSCEYTQCARYSKYYGYARYFVAFLFLSTGCQFVFACLIEGMVYWMIQVSWRLSVEYLWYADRDQSGWAGLCSPTGAKRDQNFYVPMGTDLSLWPYCWQPSSPRRITYYGSLGSPHNQPDALLCYREIISVIWEKFPNVELWIVGSNPPRFIKDLENNKLVHVTDFIEHPQEALKNMALVL